MFTLQEIYDLAIQIEKNGEDFFREAEKRTSMPALKSLFLWLAEQEVKHSKWFIQKKALSKVESEPLAMDEITGNMLKDILGDQRFSLGEVEIDRLKTVEDLLSVAMEFEEDTIIFFRMVRSLLDDDDSMKGLDEMSSNMLKDILGDQRFSLGEVEINHIKTVEDLLSIAIEFEEDTIIFFRMVRSLMDDDDSMKGLDEIIEEETNHIQMLRDFSDEGEQDLITIKEKT